MSNPRGAFTVVLEPDGKREHRRVSKNNIPQSGLVSVRRTGTYGKRYKRTHDESFTRAAGYDRRNITVKTVCFSFARARARNDNIMSSNYARRVYHFTRATESASNAGVREFVPDSL